MLSEFHIGSYNLKTFNTKVKTDPKFKANKIEKFAQVIRDENFQIIALQEVQRDKTVMDILSAVAGCYAVPRANNIGYEAGKYAAIHCESIYQEISSEYGLKIDTAKHRYGELAFIWNKDSMDIDVGSRSVVNIYKEIEEQRQKFVDGLVNAIVAVIVGAVAAKAVRKDEDEKSQAVDKAILGVAAVGKAGGGTLSKTLIENQVEAIVRSTLRPPLVGVFTLKGKGDSKRQLRLINVHAQFGETKFDKICGEQIRVTEANFLMNKLFPAVRDMRGGDNEMAETLMLGDFNVEYEDMRLAKGNANVQIVQSRPSTIGVANKEEYEQGKDPVVEYKSNYDHFVFGSESTMWNPESGIDVVQPKNSWLLAYNPENNRREFISDHLPIIMRKANF